MMASRFMWQDSGQLAFLAPSELLEDQDEFAEIGRTALKVLIMLNRATSDDPYTPCREIIVVDPDTRVP